jgi:hypothetical protein
MIGRACSWVMSVTKRLVLPAAAFAGQAISISQASTSYDCKTRDASWWPGVNSHVGRPRSGPDVDVMQARHEAQLDCIKLPLMCEDVRISTCWGTWATKLRGSLRKRRLASGICIANGWGTPPLSACPE